MECVDHCHIDQPAMQCGWSLLGPLQWVRYVNKQVKVKAGKDEELQGWMMTVDPVTASLVLVTFGPSGKASVQVVMGHAVESVEILQDCDEETLQRLQGFLLPPRSSRLDRAELQRAKDRAQAWLERNRIPVTEGEGGALSVGGGALTLAAPYGPEDCYSANQIILERIQNLLKKQPEHQEPEHCSRADAE